MSRLTSVNLLDQLLITPQRPLYIQDYLGLVVQILISGEDFTMKMWTSVVVQSDFLVVARK